MKVEESVRIRNGLWIKKVLCFQTSVLILFFIILTTGSFNLKMNVDENASNENGVLVSALAMSCTWNRQIRSVALRNAKCKIQNDFKQKHQSKWCRNTEDRLAINRDLYSTERRHKFCLFSTYDESSYSEKDLNNSNDPKFYEPGNKQNDSMNNRDLILDKKKLRQLRLLQSLQLLPHH